MPTRQVPLRRAARAPIGWRGPGRARRRAVGRRNVDRKIDIGARSPGEVRRHRWGNVKTLARARVRGFKEIEKRSHRKWWRDREPWRTRFLSFALGGDAVLVDQAAEDITTLDVGDACRSAWSFVGVGHLESEPTVGTSAVVVVHVLSQDRFEMSSSENQEPVEALPTDGADPPLGAGVRSLASVQE